MSIREEVMVTTVIPRFTAIDLMTFLHGAASRVIRVPVPVGLREFRIATGMFFSIAGITDMGCRTLAPKYASSDASAKEIVFTFQAPGTLRGSAVIMPSTSVQI